MGASEVRSEDGGAHRGTGRPPLVSQCGCLSGREVIGVTGKDLLGLVAARPQGCWNRLERRGDATDWSGWSGRMLRDVAYDWTVGAVGLHGPVLACLPLCQ